MTNAYEPPHVQDKTEAANSSNTLLTGCGCIAFPFAGALFGFFGFFAIAYSVEKLFPLPNGTPVLSHGQQAMLFTLPICILIGLGIGIASHLQLFVNLWFLFWCLPCSRFSHCISTTACGTIKSGVMVVITQKWYSTIDR